MDTKAPEFKSSSPSKSIPNWHLAKEFVSPMPSESLTSSTVFHWSVTNEASEDRLTYSLSADLEYISLLGDLTMLPQLCLSKDGSIRAQQFLSKSRPDHLAEAITHILPSLFELTLDPYANYAMQTLFQSCSSSQRLTLLTALQSKLVEVACHQKGTHALQTLISLCSSPEEEAVYSAAFKERVLELSFHVNASHVIQKLLSTIKSRHFLIRELIGHARELAVDKLGLCVIKKAINDPQIFSELSEDILTLMQDPYGNYAIQILVETWMEELSFSIICSIRGKSAQLCIQKYSSNVIEKCLKEESMRNFIIEELINEDKLKILLSSPYGCYVLRTAVRYADVPTKIKLKPHILQSMTNVSYKTLKNRWEEILSYFE